jgi:hypothetical protein
VSKSIRSLCSHGLPYIDIIDTLFFKKVLLASDEPGGAGTIIRYTCPKSVLAQRSHGSEFIIEFAVTEKNNRESAPTPNKNKASQKFYY